MKRKKNVIIFLVVCFIIILGHLLYQYIRIKTAKIEVTLVEDLTLEFLEKAKISDFVVSMNGEKILNDYEIPSTKIGKQEVTFSYINNEKIKVSYTFTINVVDTVPPLIWLGKRYHIAKDSKINLTDNILCGDNYDSNPKCTVEGEYDLHTVGDYPLTFKAIDSSGNKSEQQFVLAVYEPVVMENPKPVEDNRIDLKDIIREYKKENIKVGIDVSSWQGNIDFEKMKEYGVEFIILRIGSKNSKKEYFLDQKFEQNIKQANKYNIPVGLYFYSYADSEDMAREDAKWVLQQIKDYKIDLPIAFDWEEWNHFNAYHLSFFELSNMAEAFIQEIEKSGYQGLLYSSKNYLENIWLPTNRDIWLAHYAKETDYALKYRFWQITSNGKVDGIEGPVDINLWIS